MADGVGGEEDDDDDDDEDEDEDKDEDEDEDKDEEEEQSETSSDEGCEEEDEDSLACVAAFDGSGGVSLADSLVFLVGRQFGRFANNCATWLLWTNVI